MTATALPRSRANRLAIAFVTLLLWAAVTVLGANVSDGPMELEDLATGGIAWQVLMAGLLLVAVILWRGWRDMGFRAPAPGTLKLLWLPGLIVLALFLWAALLGLPPPGVVLLVLVNTLLVGFSEETMFRGVLYRALRGRLRIWPAILWTSAIFGAVHVFNGVLTGNFIASILQALAAASTGLLLMAILLRTGSLWAAIVFHALWDCATFLIVLSAKRLAEAEGGPVVTDADYLASPVLLVVPFLLVLPNLLYGLWLLRRVHRVPVPGEPAPRAV